MDNYHKYEKLQNNIKAPDNPVIDASLLPAGGSARDFRDPKLWREGESFFAVAADLDADGLGQILRYRSADGFAWRYDGILAKNDGSLGTMWTIFSDLQGRTPSCDANAHQLFVLLM